MVSKSTGIHFKIWGVGEKVVLIHGSNTAVPESTWLQQKTLAQRYQLVIPHRRGYGASPPIQQKGFKENVEDMIDLLGTGAHLVGTSYGGLIALLVAGNRPELVKSLTVIEPPAFAIVRKHPVIKKVIENMIPLYTSTPKSSPEDFIQGFVYVFEGQRNKFIQLSPEYRKAIIATMNEPPPWEAQIPRDILLTAQFPKLIVSGGWHSAFEIVADSLAKHISMERIIIKGAGHAVQKIGKPFNDLVERLWQIS